MLAIGRTRITWRSINLASALSHETLMPSLIIHVSLTTVGTTRLTNLNHSFTLHTHISGQNSKYGIIIMK